MTEPAEFDPETAVTALLAGKVWPIPELVWRDLKKCRAELLDLSARMSAAIDASPDVDGEGDVGRSARHMAVMSDVFNGLSNEDFDRLVMGVLFAGLVAGHPGLTRAEFEGWVTSETERQFAWMVVRRQSGLFVFSTEAPAPGEGEGAA